MHNLLIATFVLICEIFICFCITLFIKMDGRKEDFIKLFARVLIWILGISAIIGSVVGLIIWGQSIF